MSLGSACVEELSSVSLSQMHISSKARGHLLKIPPKIRKMALEVKRTYSIEVLAIRKENIPVRIAELTCGAHAILYSTRKAVKEGKTLRLGLSSSAEQKLWKTELC